jgi:predicted amidohydrolase
MDYDLLLVCANWPGSRHEAWSTLLKARAIENQAYVVGVNRVGCDGAEIPYTGNSVAIDYKGLVINECQARVEMAASATLEKGKLLQFRRHWPFFLDFD